MDDLGERHLAHLIRRSTVLDRQLKEYWLRVLPHLDTQERSRLWAILRSGDPASHDRRAD